MFLLMGVLLEAGQIKRLSRKGSNVLILHSYNSTYVWSKEVTRGINEYFENYSIEKINLYLEYLDAKRYPGDSYLEKMYILIKEKYQDITDIDLVIAADNQALSFMMKYGEDIFPGLPVIFCGINYLEHYDLSDYTHYTGINEAIRADKTIEHALAIQPEMKKLFIVSDCNTKTGIASIKQARKQLEKYNDRLKIEYPLNYTMEELQEKLRNLDDEYAVLLLIFSLDRDGDFFEVEEAGEKISAAARVPVYACWDFYMGDGVLGGALIKGYDQGNAAGAYALRLLNGEKVSDLPILMKTPFQYKYDQNILKRFGLKLPFSNQKIELINVKKNYLRENWKTLIIFLIIIVIMALYIAKLLNIQRHLKISRQNLKLKDIKWNKLAGSLPGLVFRINRDMEFLYINSYFQDLLKAPPEKIIGSHITEIGLNDEIVQINLQALNAAIESGEPQKADFKFGSGTEIRAFETTIQPEFDENGRINTLLGIVYDLTGRFQAELQLINSEQRANEARRIARLGYWEMDINSYKMNWSGELSEILGLEHDRSRQSLELLCQSINQPKDLLLRELKRREMTGEHHFDQTYKIENARGVHKYLHERGEIIVDENGRAISVYGTVQDITTEKLAEQQIRSSEAKFRAIFNHAPMGISLVNRELGFVYYNPTLLTMCGYLNKDMNDLQIRDLIHPEDQTQCLLYYQELFARKRTQFTVRKRLLCKDGSELWTFTTVTSFYSEDEDCWYALSMEMDINDRVTAEEMVAESQQLLKEAQQIAKFGYWKYDPETEMMSCSDEMLNILGYQPGSAPEISRSEFVSYLSPDNQEKFLQQLHHCVMISNNFELATTIHNRQNEELQVNIRLESQHRNGEKNSVLGTFIDITVMKSTESQLRQVEARFQLFFENSPLGIVILDGNGLVSLVNPAVLELLGVQSDDIFNHQLINYLSEHHVNAFSEQLDKIKTGSAESFTAEYQLKKNNGSLFWSSITMGQLDSESTSSQDIMLLIEDINEQKIAREELQESEEKYRSVFEVSRDGLLLTNNDTGKILEMNSSVAEMFGYQKDELAGYTIMDLAFDREKMQRLINQQEQLILGEWGLKKDENRFPMEISLNYFQRKNINYHIASIRNISERIQFESQLQDSEKKFRIIVENAPLGIIFVNEEGSIIFSNQVILRLMGCSPDRKPEKLESLLVVERRDLYKIVLEDIFTGTRSDFFEEQHIVREDGSMFWGNILISIVQTAPEKPDFAIIMIQDVTEQKEVEEKLHVYEKLESIGQLAGMIAHDFNNQLMGVLGYATILQEQLKDEEMRSYAQMIYNAAETSAALTQKLLSFARKGRHVTINQNIHKLVQETLSLVQATIQAKIKVVLKLEARSSIIPADPGQIQNALLNLILNACDAMPSGGILTISTSVMELTEADSSRFYESVTQGRYILVSISDTGSGMNEECKKRIFEPFFTTKREGKGTGLGLPAVFGTVKSHQGYISFDSKIDVGTVFNLYLPLSEIQVEEESTGNPAGYAIHGSGNIILIDDEEIVRKTVFTLLDNLGYNVNTFADGKEGLAYYAANWEEIDLILLDVIMPEIDGPEVFKRLQEINPAVKVLLFSAYSATRDVQDALDNGALGFIHKPILRDELSHKISQALADQRVNNLRSLFGIKEAPRVDLNQQMLLDFRKGLLNQFHLIIQDLKKVLAADNPEKVALMVRSLELFFQKARIKKMGSLLNELKRELPNDPEKAESILLRMEEQFEKDLE
ncbi:MAG: PAS domain S-box protein [Candidatus Cloacimonetes bacterium]|nr:PAS domain S-box protein [Candidatus Cloacimonadota bacterium]